MRCSLALATLAVFGLPVLTKAADEAPLPVVPDGWKIRLAAQAPEILFPTAIVSGPDGTLYIGQDPMDMPGPPTQPIDSILAWKDGKSTVFADKLWAVMGLEWADGVLYVVHAPYLSAFRDTNGDGKADERTDLMTGLGPKLPGFSGINDHVPSGLRLGMDGFLYIAVGDKGIPKGIGKDGKTIQLFGGGVIRIRPDGTDLEVVSTGERNPLSVALTARDDVFTYGNDDDSKKWPNSLTHHIVGAHYGYPYEFLTAPWRTLPITAGQLGGSGTQSVCYNEAGLPASYVGNLFTCDWGLSTVFRYEIAKEGATFRVVKKSEFITKGELKDFRPFSIAVSNDGAGFWLVDWAFNGWLANGPKTGRLYQLTYEGSDKPSLANQPAKDAPSRLKALDHPALSVRSEAQRALSREGKAQLGALESRLKQSEPGNGRIHALWALDATELPEARKAIRNALTDAYPDVRLQAARSVGIRRDREAAATLSNLLKDEDAAVRREAAIAVGRLGLPGARPQLIASLGDPDPFVAWSIRKAIRTLQAWDESALAAALDDPSRRESALSLMDEAWSMPVVKALGRSLGQLDSAETRTRVATVLSGLYRQYPEWTGAWFGTNPLAGEFPQKTRDWNPEAMAAVLAGLEQAASDRDAGVRLAAVKGLKGVGKAAAPALRNRLTREADEGVLTAVVQAIGSLNDIDSIPALASLAQDSKKAEPVRVAAVDGLSALGTPPALRARLSLVYAQQTPASLVARALPSLGRSGILPANDLADFLNKPEPAVRAAALLALDPKQRIPEEVKTAVADRLNDASPAVRSAAIEMTAQLKIQEAVPKLLAVANEEAFRTEATLALCTFADPQALPVYLAAIQDRNPALRQQGEKALLTIRDFVRPDLEKEATSQRLSGPAAVALERVLTRFRPLTDWRVVGPFARTTPRVFVGERTIDFDRTYNGVEGRAIRWTPRAGDPKTGRVVLDDFKEGSGDKGGFGYDKNGTPDLCSFGYIEIDSAEDRPALLLVGSSGTITLTLNEASIHTYRNFAGRPYSPESDLVRVMLKKGKNRLLATSRQGIGLWSFSVQVSDPLAPTLMAKGADSVTEKLRNYALGHEGDPRNGESLFFDPKGISCGKCHAAGGRGTANVGPDLTGLALKYDKAELIRSVLEPSSRIATGYQPVLVALTDGKVVTGLIRSETESHLELVDAEARLTKVPKEDIEDRRVTDVSLMPGGLVDTLSVVEFADLVAYLQSLKAATVPK
ncbi:HEAT repeat domain-containing protein [Singulisphaera sp. PoT]|uniref:HEAT repeat domain-containing protein n=1 Tax=Singulisphaera sp. PoT TaxID=3411797 RepID=UPI003BF59654